MICPIPRDPTMEGRSISPRIVIKDEFKIYWKLVITQWFPFWIEHPISPFGPSGPKPDDEDKVDPIPIALRQWGYILLTDDGKTI